MLKWTAVVLPTALVAVAAPALAQTPTDVPQGHWAYDAIQDLIAKGLIQNYPDGAFLGKRELTRYEIAVLLKRMLDYLAKAPVKIVEREKPTETKPVVPTPEVALDPAALSKLQALIGEFRPELLVINTDLKALSEKFAALNVRLLPLEQEVKELKARSLAQQTTLDTLKKVHLSGYLQLRFDALRGDSSLFKNAGAGGTGQRPTLGGPHVGGPSNGFLVRRGRFRVDGPLSASDAFVFQLDFGSVSGVNLRDAWADIKTSLPRNTSVRIGQFPMPFTYILPTSSRIRESPERALGYSDSGNAALVYKDTISSLGGEITAGSVVPLFNNQDRDLGTMFTYKGKRATTQWGWFNGEGRDVSGQRPLNSGLTFTGRVEQRLPLKDGNAFVGVSHYSGTYSVRGGAPTGTTPTAFVAADRTFHNVDARWEGKSGLQVRYEHLWGRFEATPDRARFLPGNRVESWYTTIRQQLNPRTALSATYDVFSPTNQTVASVSASDYRRRTLQGGVLHNLGPATRLRLWYVQALSAYDPSAAAGSAGRKKIGQFIGEVQVEY